MGGGSPKQTFRPSSSQFGIKMTGGRAARAPPLHPLLGFKSPSCFLISQNRRGRKRTQNILLFEKRMGIFAGRVVYLSHIVHHSDHGLWVVYSKFINGLIVAPVAPCALKSELNVKEGASCFPLIHDITLHDTTRHDMT